MYDWGSAWPRQALLSLPAQADCLLSGSVFAAHLKDLQCTALQAAGFAWRYAVIAWLSCMPTLTADTADYPSVLAAVQFIGRSVCTVPVWCRSIHSRVQHIQLLVRFWLAAQTVMYASKLSSCHASGIADHFAWCAGNIDASKYLLKSLLLSFRYNSLLDHHQQDSKNCKAHLPGSCFILGHLYDLQLVES